MGEAAGAVGNSSFSGPVDGEEEPKEKPAEEKKKEEEKVGHGDYADSAPRGRLRRHRTTTTNKSSSNAGKDTYTRTDAGDARRRKKNKRQRRKLKKTPWHRWRGEKTESLSVERPSSRCLHSARLSRGVHGNSPPLPSDSTCPRRHPG